MNVVDANVLLYAVNQHAEQHHIALRWLNRALSGASTVGFPWISVIAFTRIATSRSLLAQPLTIDTAVDQIELWLSSPAATIVEPTRRHLSLVQSLLAPLRIGGNIVNDAHLAALSIEHRGSVVSFDTDFALFGGITWHRPTL